MFKKDKYPKYLLLSEKEVEKYYGLNRRTLQRERCLGIGMPYVKIRKRVFYKSTDVEQHIDQHTIGKHRYP